MVIFHSYVKLPEGILKKRYVFFFLNIYNIFYKYDHMILKRYEISHIFSDISNIR